MSDSRSLVILPCYNERENLGRMVEQIAALDGEFDILVIDDNSPDGTGKLAESIQDRFPQLRVIRRPGKLGLGTAYRVGFGHALEHDYGYVLTMDADFSHQPSYLPELR